MWRHVRLRGGGSAAGARTEVGECTVLYTRRGVLPARRHNGQPAREAACIRVAGGDTRELRERRDRVLLRERDDAPRRRVKRRERRDEGGGEDEEGGELHRGRGGKGKDWKGWCWSAGASAGRGRRADVCGMRADAMTLWQAESRAGVKRGRHARAAITVLMASTRGGILPRCARAPSTEGFAVPGRAARK